jgi:signal transduction histidine kinase
MAELVAHEVNNLLNNILLHVAIMDRKGLDAARTELTVLREAGTRAGAIINRWQELVPRHTPQLQPLDLNRAVGDVVASWQSAVGGQPVKMEPAPGVPPALAEPADLKRLVRLLLANAAAAGGQGSVTVRTAATSSEVLLIVEDTGPAINPGDLEGLFSPFFVARAAPAVVDPSAPAELGYALAKALAHRLQGSIAVENRPEGGVCVEVRLRRPTTPAPPT